MKPSVCVCCGERIPETGNALSRNPNLCSSCSSLSDGMEEADPHESFHSECEPPPAGESPEDFRKAA
jgi:hypothetical protein